MKKAFALLATAAALVLSLGLSPALANDDDGYLALGDSVAFGFSPLADRSDADNFVGYPEKLAEMLDLDLTNASCPGEASGGFISLTGFDNSCRPYRANFPLHVDYTTSQLDFAVAFLKTHRGTKLVTLNIGANDLFILQRQCTTGKPPVVDPNCVLRGLPNLLSTLGANITTIEGRIRAAGFHGQLVALTYYVLNYSDQNQVQVVGAINQVEAGVTKAFGGQVADGFGAFGAVAAGFGGDSCAAGLLIRLTPTTCDIHPSPKGRDVLAGAIRAVVSLPVEAN